MKLWRLERLESGYDEYESFVIRAEDEAQARQGAHDFIVKDRGWTEPWPEPTPRWARVATDWLHPATATCVEIPVDGPAEIVHDHFHHG